jgi:hypothetical protein
MTGRKYRLRQGTTNDSNWRSWLKKNILTIALGLGGIAATIMAGTWADPLLDLAPLDRTRSDVCHAAAFISISAWA